jgi:hypothetical protein
MPTCAAVKPNGERCKISVEPYAEFCWAHDPRNREHRRRITSKAGKSRPNKELTDIRALLEDLTDKVLSGELQSGPAAVANQLINTRIRAIEKERKLKETEELAREVEELRLMLDARKERSG